LREKKSAKKEESFFPLGICDVCLLLAKRRLKKSFSGKKKDKGRSLPHIQKQINSQKTIFIPKPS
jgi:hypothetical protein